MRAEGLNRFRRLRPLRLPYDPPTAARLRRLLRFERLNLWVLLPAYLLALAGFLSWPHSSFRVFFYLIFLIFNVGNIWLRRRLAVRPYPKWIGSFGVYLADVEDVVAWEWAGQNPQVAIVPQAPVPPPRRWWVYLLEALGSGAVGFSLAAVGFESEAWFGIFALGVGGVLMYTALVYLVRAISQVGRRGDLDHA
jgi:hypothetical protein